MSLSENKGGESIDPARYSRKEEVKWEECRDRDAEEKVVKQRKDEQRGISVTTNVIRR